MCKFASEGIIEIRRCSLRATPPEKVRSLRSDLEGIEESLTLSGSFARLEPRVRFATLGSAVLPLRGK